MGLFIRFNSSNYIIIIVRILITAFIGTPFRCIYFLLQFLEFLAGRTIIIF